MTLDIDSMQDAVMTYLQIETGAVSYDTDYPDVADEPTENGVLVAYNVVRSNSPNKTPNGEAFGGAVWDEKYTLIDVLSIAATPGEARELAYGVEGVAEVLTGFKPDANSGQMYPTGGGAVFVAGDGTASKPRRFIARNSFRVQIDLIHP